MRNTNTTSRSDTSLPHSSYTSGPPRPARAIATSQIDSSSMSRQRAPARHTLPFIYTPRRSIDSASTEICDTPAPETASFSPDSMTSSEDTSPSTMHQKQDHALSPTPQSPTRSHSAPGQSSISFSESRRVQFRERSITPPKQTKRPVVAMPGTMSARPKRGESPLKSRKSGNKRERHSGQDSDERGVLLGRRFRSAFRDIFHKDTPDNKSFERIEDKHWSDDY